MSLHKANGADTATRQGGQERQERREVGDGFAFVPLNKPRKQHYSSSTLDKPGVRRLMSLAKATQLLSGAVGSDLDLLDSRAGLCSEGS